MGLGHQASTVRGRPGFVIGPETPWLQQRRPLSISCSTCENVSSSQATSCGAVSEPIQRSWQRSMDAGLLPDQVHAPLDPDVDADGLLRWAAAPAMTAVSLDLPTFRRPCC